MAMHQYSPPIAPTSPKTRNYPKSDATRRFLKSSSFSSAEKKQRSPSPLVLQNQGSEERGKEFRASSAPRKLTKSSSESKLMIESAMEVKIRTRYAESALSAPFSRNSVKRPQSVDLVFPISPIGNRSEQDEGEVNDRSFFMNGSIVEEIAPLLTKQSSSDSLTGSTINLDMSNKVEQKDSKRSIFPPVFIPELDMSDEVGLTRTRHSPSHRDQVDEGSSVQSSARYYTDRCHSTRSLSRRQENVVEDTSYRYALMRPDSPSANSNCFKNRVAAKKLDWYRLNNSPKEGSDSSPTSLYVRSPLSTRSVSLNCRSPGSHSFSRSTSCPSMWNEPSNRHSGGVENNFEILKSLTRVEESSGWTPPIRQVEELASHSVGEETRGERETSDPERTKTLLLSSPAKPCVFVSPFSLSPSGAGALRYHDLPVRNYQDALHRSKLKQILENYMSNFRDQHSPKRRVLIYERIGDICDSFPEDVKVTARTCGLLSILMENLRNGDKMRTQSNEEWKHLLLLLGKLCKNDVENKEFFRRNRGISKLVDVLKNERSIYLVDSIYETLLDAFLSNDHIAMKEFREFGGVAELTHIMEQSTSERDAILDILFRVVLCIYISRHLTVQELVQRDLNLREFTMKGGVNLLLRLFAELKQVGEKYALNLAALCKHSVLVRNELAGLDTISTFLNYILKHPSCEILEAISAICDKHEALQQSFRERNGFIVFEKLVSATSTSVLIKLAILRTAGIICLNNKDNKEQVHRSGFALSICRMIGDHQYSIELARTVNVLSRGHAHNQTTFSGCIPPFVNTIQQIDIGKYRSMEEFLIVIRTMSQAILVLCDGHDNNIALAQHYLRPESLIRCLKLLVPNSEEHCLVTSLIRLVSIGQR